MPEIPAESLDRLLAGELSREEERRLARAALDDPDLFETLTAAAVAKAGVGSGALDAVHAGASDAPAPGSSAGRQIWKPLVLATGLSAAAAALVLAVAFEWRARPSTATPAATSAPAPAAPVSVVPELLTARMDMPATTAFRDDTGPASRAPRRSGTIVRSSDGIAEIDLGSIDGLTQGMTIAVVRSERPIDRMTLTSVFRDRARGHVGSAGRSGSRVEVDPATHVRAVLEQVSARNASGDRAAARDLARAAVAASGDPAVPADIRRQSLTVLGVLESDNNRDEAIRMLREAVGSFDATPPATAAERADVLNQLGVLEIEQRDFAGASRTFATAQSVASGIASVRLSNNRGALAALQGDRAGAEQLYRAAASLAASVPSAEAERQAIARNLAALSASD
jgi:hypothetical protein